MAQRLHIPFAHCEVGEPTGRVLVAVVDEERESRGVCTVGRELGELGGRLLVALLGEALERLPVGVAHVRSTFSMGRPFASSSTSLSR